MIDTGFVIANGSSRIGYDFRQNFLDGIFYGCNAIHRSMSCQYITITKQTHLAEAISWDIDTKSKIFTTELLAGQLRNPNLNIIPKPQFITHGQINSGTGAALIAAHNHSNLFLFGFDFFLSNSVYFDTENYLQPVKDKVVNRMPKHTQEIANLVEYFDECNFTFVNDEYELPEVIAINKNAKSISYKQLNFA
mgnify:CR=1 FL=1